MDERSDTRELVSPTLSIPADAPSASLVYCSRYDGERGSADPPTGFDRAWVSVNGVLVDDVGPTASLDQWEERSVDLTPYISQTITITWHFDSVDEQSNDTLGWQVDDIRVLAAEMIDNDCDGNGVPDECDPDFDGDGLIDGCDPDIDDDGVPNEDDVCDCTPTSLPPELIEPDGSVKGDLDGDCDVDMDDFNIMQQRFTGPNP